MSFLILLIIIIVLLDGIVSLAEAAILSLPVNRARFLAGRNPAGRTLLGLKESMGRPITTLISLSNLITVIGSVVSGAVAINIFGEQWIGIFAALLTFTIMIFAEIIPKKIGERYAESVAIFIAPPLWAIAVLFSPIIWFIEKITSPFSAKGGKPLVSEEEIKFMVRLGEKEGAIEEYESRFIERVFKLKDVTASDIMTPRPFVFFLNGGETIGEAREDIENAKHSRIPIYKDDLNNIIGIAHQRDLLRALAQNRNGTLIKDYVREPLVVPESRIGDDLLKDFLNSHSHLAIVVDEHGSVAGVVGLEDVFEEIVGEIIDEKDVSPEFIKRIARNVVLAHGQTQISYLNRFFNLQLPVHKTLNGFLLDKFGRLPKAGESLRIDNVIFTIEESKGGAIKLIKIIKED